MKKLSFSSSAVAVFVAAGSAFAADIPAPAYKAPVMAPIAAYSWTGCYIGGNGGYGWGSNSASLRPSSDPASQAFWNPAFNAGAAPSTFSYTTTGGIAGGQIGCNYQVNSFVVGLEADLDWANITGSQTINTSGVPGFVPGFFSSGQTLDWLGTVRGRLGFTPADRWLVYVTGGLAYGQTSYNLNFAFPGSNDFHTISASNTNAGWTVGGGVEWAFWNNWTVKAEYLYVDLGNQTFTSVPSGRAPNLATTLTETFQNRTNIVRVGVNYRF